MSAVGFKAGVGGLICVCLCYMFPEIHLCCDTCHPLGTSMAAKSISSMYLQAGIGWGLKPGTVALQMTALPTAQLYPQTWL